VAIAAQLVSDIGGCDLDVAVADTIHSTHESYPGRLLPLVDYNRLQFDNRQAGFGHFGLDKERNVYRIRG
jgi:hypothetical protein